MKRRSILTGAMFALGVAALPATVHAQDRTVTIAMDGGFAPYNFTEGGELKGFEVDLAHDLCERANLKCELVTQDWDGLIPGLVARKFDGVMAAMSITDKRRETIEFSVPYVRARNGFFAAMDSELGTLPGTGDSYDLTNNEEAAKAIIERMKPLLQGKVIGLQGSSTNATFIEAYFKDVFEVREYKTSEESELDLLAGRIDALVQSISSLAATKKNPQFDNYTIFGSTFFGGPFGVGVGVGLRKDDAELKAIFDKAIAEAIADGTVARLTKQWFDVDLTPIDPT